MSPHTLNFRAAPDATATASITIRDTGAGALHVNVGAPKHDPPFSILSGGGAFTIPGHSSATVTVQYAPVVKGTINDSISITSDDPKQKKPIDVKLKGKSKAPRR